MEGKTSTATAAATAPQDQRSYLAMLALAFFAGQTGLARAYRGDQIGWTRFWLWIGANVTMIIPFVNFLSALVLLVLGIWGIVDFFMVYKLRDDSTAKPLHTTPTDQKWAKVMRTLYIIGLALAAVAVLFSIILMIIGVRFWENSGKTFDFSSSWDSSYQQNESNSSASSSEKTKALDGYAKLTEGMSKAEVEELIGVTDPNCSEYSSDTTTVNTCSYGSYADGYMITISYQDDALSYKSKYSY